MGTPLCDRITAVTTHHTGLPQSTHTTQQAITRQAATPSLVPDQ